MGAHVAKSLRNSGFLIKCLSNSPSREDDVLYTDFSDRKHIRATLMEHGVPDTFVHLGWGDVYQPHSAAHLTANLHNGINLVDEFFDNGTERFILIGSSSEYGERVGPLTEHLSPEGALNNYVKGKTALAKYGLRAADHRKRKFIHVRLFYTYGAGQKHNSLINQLFQSYLSRQAVNLSPCEQYRDYIHVSEAAEAIKRICCVDQSAILNLGGGDVIQLKEFVKLFWAQLGGPPESLMFGAHPRPAHEQCQPYAYADLKNLYRFLNWRPTLSIKEGIRISVLELMHQNPDLYRL